MELYSNFIGIDIGKYEFFVATHGKKLVKSYENNSAGIGCFLSDYKHKLKRSFCVLEATGGYEMALLLALCQRKFAVHRANTRKVKNFIRSFGNAAKTDVLDARALAHYGNERHEQLDKFTPASEQTMVLFSLVERKNDLNQMLVAEKNRAKSPSLGVVKSSIDVIIEMLEKELLNVNDAIKALIASDDVLSQKHKILKTIPGVGEGVSSTLLAMMPELGQMNRRQAASLAGLAPRANDSGQSRGYRRVAPGRNKVKPMLFLAAMAARNSKSELKEFYERLVGNGKQKMVALNALMRKIVVIANARIKEANI